MSLQSIDVVRLNAILESGTREELDDFVKNNRLVIRDGKIYPLEESEGKEAVKYWDKLQLVRKVNLNSLYGALLNHGCRFYDHRIGQSTTLTGRSITRHMNAQINKEFTGKYEYDGDTIIYLDTDSSYFSVCPMLKKDEELDLDSAVALYDHITDRVTGTFGIYMQEAFNTSLEKGRIIKAGREVVASSGIFVTKKRYALMVNDKEGFRYPDGKLKAMGLDLKRADTPEFVQDFLEDILTKTLKGEKEKVIIQDIRKFKDYFRSLQKWEMGTPKRVNNLSAYTDRSEGVNKDRVIGSSKKANNMIPGHVMASINWNILRGAFGDHHSMPITDGSKVIVCRLRPNPMGYNSIAWPIDEQRLPDWFKELPFDAETMEAAIVSKKVQNVLGETGWDLDKANEAKALGTFFSFN